MKHYGREETMRKMNILGEQKTPFLAIISFNMNNNIVLPLNDINPEEIIYDINGIKNYKDENHISETVKLITADVLPYSEYEKAFLSLMRRIERGDTYLCNLTFDNRIELNKNLKDIFFASIASYKLWLRDRFVCFSPEKFVSTNKNIIKTYPMKGTIDADEKNAMEKLLSDEKEKAEHYTITDLLRNDLSIVSKNVKVNKFRFVDLIETNHNKLLQTSSEISGELPQNWQAKAGNILFRLLPAGSVTGAPKGKTVDIINKLEKHKRNFYTGVTVFFDGENIDSFVMIRMIEERNRKYYYKSGGGITSHSNAKKEFNEMKQKIYVPLFGNN